MASRSAQEIVKELFVDLDTSGLIDTTKQIPNHFKKIVAKGQDTNSMLQVVKNLKISGQIAQFIQVNRLWFSSEQLELIISNQLIHHTLDSLELAKEILKLVLKYNVEYNGKKFTENDTLGNLLDKFSQMFHKPYYNKLFDNAIRKSIAHNQYWWENNKFVYVKEGHDTPLSDIEFTNAFNNIQEVGISIINQLKNRGFSF